MRKLENGAFGRGAVGYEVGSEAASGKSNNWVLLVALYQQSSSDIQRSDLLRPKWYHEFAICTSSQSGAIYKVFSTNLAFICTVCYVMLCYVNWLVAMLPGLGPIWTRVSNYWIRPFLGKSSVFSYKSSVRVCVGVQYKLCWHGPVKQLKESG